jgi:hypothetical protein
MMSGGEMRVRLYPFIPLTPLLTLTTHPPLTPITSSPFSRLSAPLFHTRLSARADKQLSLGDARSYYLSTAANELGVIWAKSEIGNVMVPVSYQEMEDSVTGVTERRKVAKPEDI